MKHVLLSIVVQLLATSQINSFRLPLPYGTGFPTTNRIFPKQINKGIFYYKLWTKSFFSSRILLKVQMKRRRPSNQKILRKHWQRVLMWKTWLTICEFTRADSSWKDWKRRFVWSTWICYSTSQRRTESFWKKRLIVFDNHRKSLNSTLRAKRATFTFWVDKS